MIKAFTKMVRQVRATQFCGHGWFLALLLISTSRPFSFSSDHLWYPPGVPYLSYKWNCFIPQICTDLAVIYLTLLYIWRRCCNQCVYMLFPTNCVSIMCIQQQNVSFEWGITFQVIYLHSFLNIFLLSFMKEETSMFS